MTPGKESGGMSDVYQPCIRLCWLIRNGKNKKTDWLGSSKELLKNDLTGYRSYIVPTDKNWYQQDCKVTQTCLSPCTLILISSLSKWEVPFFQTTTVLFQHFYCPKCTPTTIPSQKFQAMQHFLYAHQKTFSYKVIKKSGKNRDWMWGLLFSVLKKRVLIPQSQRCWKD